MNDKSKQIRVNKKDVKRMRDMKEYPRETDGDMFEKLVDSFEENIGE